MARLEEMSKEELIREVHRIRPALRRFEDLVAEQEPARLVRDLRAHQVELEMQNRELRQAQSIIENSRNRYSDLYDFAPVGYCSLDSRGRIQDINLTGAALLRTPRDRLVDLPLSTFIWAEDIQSFRAHLQKCGLGDGRVATEVRLAIEGRGSLVAQLVSVPLRDANARVAGYRTAIVDITSLTQFEDRLRFLADLGDRLAWSLDFRKIVTAVAELAVPFLADLCLIDLVDDSGVCKRVVAVFADRKKQAKVSERTKRQPSAKGPALQAGVLASGDPLLIEEIAEARFEELARDDEHLRLLPRAGPKSLMIVALRTGGGVVGTLTFAASAPGRHYVGDDLVFAQEIARRASMAMDNARLHEQARRAVQSREDLLAVVSHDLRNPLSVILVSATLALRAWPPGDANRRTIEAIRRSALRMDRLIGDLLDASTIEAGRLSLETAVQPVDQIVRDAVEALEAPAAQKQLKLEAKSGIAEVGVFCDRGRMLQVFSNIVGNAIKFTPEGGSIVIRVEPREREVWFFVTDTGPGIPEDQLPRLFDRFWQAKRTARLGTGLGLTIAKGIIEAQEGRIGVESQLGIGSTFYFTLPRANPAAAPDASSAQQASETGQGP
jgi:PAS domain S-box-containing protein